MSSLDPISMATQLATYDVQPFQQRYKTQADQYQAQLTALGKVETALRDFRSSMEAMNSSTNSVVKNSATLSQEGYLSASVSSQALAGNYQVFVEKLATAQQDAYALPNVTDTNAEFGKTGTLTLTVGDESADIEVTADMSLADLVKTINNSDDNPGVNASLVRSNGATHLMLSSTETGEDNAFTLTDSNNILGTVKGLTTAQDATIRLGGEDGIALTSSTNTFKGVIDGVDLTVTKAQAAGDAAIGMKVGADDEATKEQMDKFVSSYNSLISTIKQYTAIGGEDKARGVLASDPTLRSIESQLNGAIRGAYGDDNLRLSSAGLSIDREGKMQFDADKFKEMQANNSAGLESLFNGDDSVFDKIDTALDPFLKFSSGLFATRKDSLQQSISRINDKQDDLDRKYDMAYTRYLKQFTQMNNLMTQMNQTMTMFG